MLFYDCTFTHNGELKLTIESTYSRFGRGDDIVSTLFTINDKFSMRNTYENTFCISYYYDEEIIKLAVGVWQGSHDLEEVCHRYAGVAQDITENFEIKLKSYKEITFKEASELLEMALDKDYYRGSRRDAYKMDVYDSRRYVLTEECLEKGSYSYQKICEMSDEIMGSDSLREELDRIYAEGNMKKFYGCPVHYRIQTKNLENAKMLIRVLVKALHSNNRLLSSRICMLDFEKGNENYYGENLCKELDNLGYHSEGGCVVISSLETNESGQYATENETIAIMLRKFLRKYADTVQIFVIEDETNPGFSKILYKELAGKVDFVKISEGVGDITQAQKYMDNLANASKYQSLFDKNAYKYLPDRKYFSASMVAKAFLNWSEDVLKKSVYPSYSKVCIHKAIKKTKRKNNAYEELMNMVGLNEIKQVTQQIISTYKLSKYKNSYGINSSECCRHMVFMGNPGCAKTTVARLLCDILRKEEVLKTGKFVECGRADLVGRYVGWTAKEVKAKFRAAKGGILFIDEAYSLVDSTNSFGTEAINTIVQEMENSRDDVIVIFAGYPEPMEKFIAQNEGMKSRIAFTLNFPDYTPEELMKIMDLMLTKKGLEVDLPARSECQKIFQQAVLAENYGNGRFVRNLLEQATLKQASRLLPPGSKNKPTKSEVKLLKKEDFSVNLSQMLKDEPKREIGFASNF